MKLTTVKTDSNSLDFVNLVSLLDRDLLSRYGDQQTFFDQFNKTDTIRHVIVAYVDGVPAGCGAIKHTVDNCMEIKRMYVVGEHRGRGIAKLILNALETWSVELGFNRCVLETGKSQPEAISLYRKVGYVLIDNYGPYIGVENSVCMEKQLTADF